MPQRILAALAALVAFAAFAADVNTASQADLEAVKGIGPGTASRILEERGKGRFRDWSDFIARVHGIGGKSAARLSQAGLSVDGAAYAGAPERASSAASR